MLEAACEELCAAVVQFGSMGLCAGGAGDSRRCVDGQAVRAALGRRLRRQRRHIVGAARALSWQLGIRGMGHDA